MTLGIVGSDELYQQILTLNFRNEYDIRHIVTRSSSPLELRKALEGDTPYTDVLLDLTAVGRNVEDGINLLDRLRTTTQHHFMVLAPGYSVDSRLVQDLKILGIDLQDIFTLSGSSMKSRISELLQQGLHADQEPAQSAEPGEAAAEPILAATTTLEPVVEAVPPSQVDVAAAKARQIHKPIRPISHAVTIAVTGSCSRIGTTTQALQLLLYLKSQGYRCAMIDMAGAEQLQQYADLMQDSIQIGPFEWQLQGIPILTNAKLLMQARNAYDYILCDYGPYQGIIEPVGYWEKDIKIAVAGTKPWESAPLQQLFEDEDGSLSYIFSFVPESDHAAVRQQMADSASKTFFAPFAPDYFTYCGQDDFYSKLISAPAPAAQREQKGFRFLKFKSRKNR